MLNECRQQLVVGVVGSLVNSNFDVQLPNLWEDVVVSHSVKADVCDLVELIFG